MNKAFTLIEILVVIAVITILAAVSLAGLRAIQPSLQLRSVSRDLATDLRNAQQMAIAEQVDYGIRFSSTTDEYSLIKYGTTTETVFTKLLSDGIDFQEISGFNNDEAIFNAYGAVQEIGAVSLINSKNATKTIEVKPSGFVKVLPDF